MRFLGCVVSLFLFLAWAQAAQAATPLAACTDGVVTVGSGSSAVNYPCLRIDLLSHLSIPELGGTADTTAGKNNAVSDIWGWVSSGVDGIPGNADDREFAIIGLYCSTAFVEITDPVNPVLIGTLADHTEIPPAGCYEAPVAPKRGMQKHEEAGATWRDIKVINDYAYIVSDHAGAGLQIFDLSRLLPAVTAPVDFTEDKNINGFSKAHNLFIYEGVTGSTVTPYAVVVGSNDSENPGVDACTGTNAGGPIFYDLTDPLNPLFAGKYCDDGYTHDIQCVVYTGPDTAHQNKEICLASNEDTLTVFDATNKSAFVQLARKGYNNVAYTHQGWLDETQTYFFLNDELDEKNYGFPTRTMVWDVSDLDNPTLVEEYLAPLVTIDHNNYAIGDYLYQSNYTSGLRILDISDPENPYQKAFFDTFPASNAVVFDGSWSNYAWYPSGVIAVSDISNGLFVVQPVFDEINSTDVSITVSAPQSSYMYQVPFTYTVEATNNGAVTATNVYITLRLSPSLTFNSQSESTPECTVVAPQLMECRLGDIGAGITETVTVLAAGFIDTQGSVIAMVSADQKDTAPANNRMNHQVTLIVPPVDDGGGAAGWLLLPGLLSLVWLRRRVWQ